MTTALVFGATGFIGSHLVEDLLNNPDYTRVIAVVRKPLALSHPKLTVLIGDLATLPALGPQFVADEVFIALGTTRAHTPDEADYYK
ncbi:epimerase, partial [Lactobacillus crispatus]|uniref:NAD(P)H-binding protein n=1 Tax=Lactobacillus crispatus TaxID=47770 RepID=UPI00105E093B